MRILMLSVLILCLVGCGTSAGKNNVTWEFEGEDIRVFEKSLEGEGERRTFFTAGSVENVSISGHVVKVLSNGEAFKIICFDEKQARELADILQ